MGWQLDQSSSVRIQLVRQIRLLAVLALSWGLPLAESRSWNILDASQKDDGLVTSLPGFSGAFPSRHFAGYITVDEVHDRNLFYYFVESERSPTDDPLVLWLNGGPGCSSFDGFVYEHGPFKFHPDNGIDELPTLKLNKYSWSKVANTIYLDSPAFVGLSYSRNETDAITNDLRTAEDTHTFLLKWLQQYPRFLDHDFYIAGESYAGIYVPTLAREVDAGIEAGVEPKINFKGYAVGNGCTDERFDGNAIIPFTHGMGLIDDDLYEALFKEAGGEFWNASSKDYSALLDRASDDTDGLNIYDILEKCFHPPNPNPIAAGGSILTAGLTNLPADPPPRVRMFGRGWPLLAPLREGHVPSWPELNGNGLVPCMDDRVGSRWLNDEAVRTAIHARPVSDIGPWLLCTGRIAYTHNAGSMVPIHRNLTGKGYRVLIYSGDHDMCVPYTGSEAWTRSLNYEVEQAWRPWIITDESNDKQVAGYTVRYGHNLTFATVKGSGHTVPEYKPAEGLKLFTSFLDGVPL
ncbi:serine carboxypeptidase [Klebsormidium nitens]|uniref:Carboxypeptidase n=1 Tax=Klebsormidium nitens TaxID=105231 RepID=A0A1Y1IMC2_KLENI|nr:serine carboxypeptidase [Klebsormidium nitens]|eukprot:GAQ91793.1 serine carboxypeptidase [Klebsormidium nitens]